MGNRDITNYVAIDKLDFQMVHMGVSSTLTKYEPVASDSGAF